MQNSKTASCGTAASTEAFEHAEQACSSQHELFPIANKHASHQCPTAFVLLPCVSNHRSWAECELLDTLMRLEVGLAGRVESWKANRWAAKLEELKTKNSSLVSLQCV